MTRPEITTVYNSPRYAKYLEDINGTNVSDINGNLVTGITGTLVNKIDTQYKNPRETGQGLWFSNIQPWEEDFFPWMYGMTISTSYTPRTKPTTIIK